MTKEASGRRAPIVTVLMPVYNAGPYLLEALESILVQTYGDFELLVIDDGSTDGSSDQVAAVSDARVRLFRQPENLGIVAALNRGLDLARGVYIVRMDADDISLPDRLARQVAFMDSHSDVAVCGCRVEAFHGEKRNVWKNPVENDDIVGHLLFESTIYHPTVIFRREVLQSHGLRYSNNYPHAEDYELWTRCRAYGRLANLSEVLLHYRIHGESVGGREKPAQIKSSARVRAMLIATMGITPSVEDLCMHEAIARGRPLEDEDFLLRAHDWLWRLREANSEKLQFPEPAFTRVLARRWLDVCLHSRHKGMMAYIAWKKSKLRKFHRVSLLHRMLFLGQCALKQGHLP